MALNGLTAPPVNEAYTAALSDPGGWLLLRYTARDEVEVYRTGSGGHGEASDAISQFAELAPLYGLLLYRRRKVVFKYIPEGTSRLLQARTTVHFQAVLDRFSPHDAEFSAASPGDLNDKALSACCQLHTEAASPRNSSGSLKKKSLNEIEEDEEPVQSSNPQVSGILARLRAEKKSQPPQTFTDTEESSSYHQHDHHRHDLSTSTQATSNADSRHVIERGKSTGPRAIVTPWELVDITSLEGLPGPHITEFRPTFSDVSRPSYDQRPSTSSTFKYGLSSWRPKVKLSARPVTDDRRLKSTDELGRQKLPSGMKTRQHKPELPTPKSSKASVPTVSELYSQTSRSRAASSTDPRARIRPMSPPSTYAASPTPPPRNESLPRNQPNVTFLSPEPPPASSVADSVTSGNQHSVLSPEKQRLMRALQMRRKQLGMPEHVSNLGSSVSVDRSNVLSPSPPWEEMTRADSAVEMERKQEPERPMRPERPPRIPEQAEQPRSPEREVDTPKPVRRQDSDTPKPPDNKDTTVSEPLDRSDPVTAKLLENKDTNTLKPPRRRPVHLNAPKGFSPLMSSPITPTTLNFAIAARQKSETESFPTLATIESRENLSERKDSNYSNGRSVGEASRSPLGRGTESGMDSDGPSQVGELQEARVEQVRSVRNVSISSGAPAQHQYANGGRMSPSPITANPVYIRSGSNQGLQIRSQAPSQAASPEKPKKSFAKRLQAFATGSSKAESRPSSRGSNANAFPRNPVVSPPISSNVSRSNSPTRKPPSQRHLPISNYMRNKTPDLLPSIDTALYARSEQPASISESPRSPNGRAQSESAHTYSHSRGNGYAQSHYRNGSNLSGTQPADRAMSIRSSNRPPSRPGSRDSSFVSIGRSSLESSKKFFTGGYRRSHESRTPTSPSGPSTHAKKSLEQIDEEESRRQSRTSKLFKRMSGTAGISQSSKNALAALGEGTTGAAADRRPQTERPAPPMSIVVGDLNVQFPDTLLWKRRWVEVDRLGNLVLSPPQLSPILHQPGTSITSESFGRGGAANARKYHMGSLSAPYMPSHDRMELPNSLCMDIGAGAGGTLQIACDDSIGLAQVMRRIGDCWKGWNGAT